MRKNLFFSLDLNLLRTFMVLSQELNMRKASEKLFVTQPAISQSLKKLRFHFDDELFTKSRTGLSATPFAEELAANLKPHMDGLQAALNETTEFDPATITRPLRLALAPQVLSTVAGRLVTALKTQAPGIDLQLVNWNMSTLEDIVRGDIDFGVSYELPSISKEVMNDVLFNIQSAVIVRNGHPVNKAVVTPHDMEGYELASLIIPGWNNNQSLAASVMEQLGLEYSIGFSSELPSAILDVVQQTDMYFPSHHLFPIEHYPNLRMMDVEVDCVPSTYEILGYYHQKDRNSDFTQWLKHLLIDVLEQQNH
ncbi:LysR family transcriptional regulator [Enterovibrio sp. ZSDZ35]|uniref:LysR family transcriptional regulator n=1 Tax=Enterovibrio qingdaonensis TaxID=2899818 RepID=A0ABT5QTK2_9GAMM|nr:LysR family transcriptional regulator [Enterovibrio sp. ZSDZ35]MDD1783616.1 LysR family transcriptional regulator [Enterovibrio sp. ZSDZ35]